MYLETLKIERLRTLDAVTLSLSPGLNVLIGPNGAGKTSVLEAAHLLSHARSFRDGSRDALIQRDARDLVVFGVVGDEQGRRHRLGLRRSSAGTEGRIDEVPAPTLGELLRCCAVICFEPGSHALISGPSEGRRRFLDWLLFHVEPGFLDTWKRYQRNLRQRNAALRAGADDATLEGWEAGLAQEGEALAGQREAWLQRLRPMVAGLASRLLGELGACSVFHQRGWRGDQGLAEALAEGRDRDRILGHTRRGPHRGDWSLGFDQAPERGHLSRGQEKLSALICLLAQAALYREQLGTTPIFALDDFASELDEAHQRRVAAELAHLDGQVLVTGVTMPSALAEWPRQRRLFHVEHGLIEVVAG
ncbi:MAG TPA: DNA replication/repair protein RecF [Xanthomonadaceae bacterium]|nr:DNA replication/repair protein RecF [Xanthomonadaceae bacterium]